MERADVVILGAGFSGLSAAMELRRRTRLRTLVLEKAHDVGGAWRDNVYPGVECDVPSHLYSLSTALSPEWSKTYAAGGEIHAYIRSTFDRSGTLADVRFGAHVVRCDWMNDRWTCTCADGRRLESRFLISGLGALHMPNLPDFAGLDAFRGRVFHTSRWNESASLAGSRVAVIGTGASAVQVAPKIADVAATLRVVQRSPIWVGPKRDEPYADEERERFRADEQALRRHRWELWKKWELASVDVVRPGTAANTKAERSAREHLTAHVRDRETARRLTPQFNFACKRPTYSNAYYPMFNRPNVTLDTRPIRGFTRGGLVLGDEQHDVDTVVLATGFKAFDITSSVTIRGVGGRELADAWAERITTYRSVMVPGFPNLFLLLGPNSGGLTSALQMIEGGTRMAVNMIRTVIARGACAAQPRAEPVAEFTRHVDELTDRSAIGHGCESWWTRDGHNHTLWPDSSIAFRLMMNEIRPDDFEFLSGADVG